MVAIIEESKLVHNVWQDAVKSIIGTECHSLIWMSAELHSGNNCALKPQHSTLDAKI